MSLRSLNAEAQSTPSRSPAPSFRSRRGGRGISPEGLGLYARILPAVLALIAVVVLPASAEYVVLRSGQRLHVTGYERLGDTMRLQLGGGRVEVPAEEVVSIEPEDFFPARPKPAPLNVPYGEMIRAAAEKHGLDAELIASVIAVESNFNPRAISRRQARGLMQLLPETAARFAVSNVFDPAQNIDAGTRYLKELLEKYNQDLALALAAYNAGPDRVEQFQGVPPYRETRNYVHRVTQTLRTHKTSRAGAAAKKVTTPPRTTMTQKTAAPKLQTTPRAPSTAE